MTFVNMLASAERTYDIKDARPMHTSPRIVRLRCYAGYVVGSFL